MKRVIQDELEWKTFGPNEPFVVDIDVVGYFINLYERYFDAFVNAKNIGLSAQELRAKISEEPIVDRGSGEFSVLKQKLEDEFNIVRPYYFEYKGKIYLFRRTLKYGVSEVIYELDNSDMIEVLEQSMDWSFMEKRKRNKFKEVFENITTGKQ